MDTIKETAYEDGERIEREQIETEDKADPTDILHVLIFDPKNTQSWHVGSIPAGKYSRLLAALAEESL